MIKIKVAEVSVHTFRFHPQGLCLRSGFLQIPSRRLSQQQRESWRGRHLPRPCTRLPGSVTPNSAPTSHAESCLSWDLIQIHPSRSPLCQSPPRSAPVQACHSQQSREWCWAPANSLSADAHPPRVGGQALGWIRKRLRTLLPTFPSVRCYVSCETTEVQWSMCKEMSLLGKTQLNFNFSEWRQSSVIKLAWQ